MSAGQSNRMELFGAMPPALAMIAGALLVTLPAAIQTELHVAPADLGVRTKLCVMVAVLTGAALILRGATSLTAFSTNTALKKDDA